MPAMLEITLASLGAAVCLALLVRMFLPVHARQRLDGQASRLWQALRRGLPRRPRGGVPRVARRADARAANQPRLSAAEAQRLAEREAQDVIDRVRRQARADTPVARDGNVYRPDAFKPRPPKDKLH